MLTAYRILRTAFRSLRRNVLRSALTTLGIVIGVAAVIAMMEIGQGSATAVKRTIAAMGADNLMIQPGAASSGGVTFGFGSAVTLTPGDVEAIARECPAVHSVAGLLDPTLGAVTRRPFRAPHHSVSTAGLVGGGSAPRPGEVSLAHHGVLFLDELLEFPRAVLEALRQPMEDGFVSIARATASLRFPARFALVAAMNPCPCGHAGDVARACVCAAADVLRYRSRLSGPLADRIDMHVQVPPVSLARLVDCEQGERSSSIRERVEAARRRQRVRYREDSCNARAPGRCRSPAPR